MIVGFFRSNNATAFIFLPILAAGIWVFGFMEPAVVYDRHAMPLYELIARPLTGFPWIGNLIGLLLVIGEAFLLNYIVNENEVITRQSFLPALFYIVFMSNNSAMLCLHPLLFSNLFVILAIGKLLNSYRKDNAFSESFDAGFLLSLASLFYFPCIVFFPLMGVAFILLRPFNWREWMISFFGVLIPFLFVAAFYFVNESWDYLIHDKMLFNLIKPITLDKVPPSFYFLMITGWVIVLLAFFNLFSGLGTGPQKTKKSIILLIWIFLFSGISVLIAPKISTVYFSTLAIPASVFCSNYFMFMKRAWIAELLFALLLGGLIVNLIMHYF